MNVSIRSFAKINLGLRIGAPRPDGFHALRTIYQTIALHDVIGVSIERGSGIEIRCDDARVPKDATNTCFRIVKRAAELLKPGGRVVIEIEKRLPVQGGLGGASGNAVATLLALERVLHKKLSMADRLRIAAEVGSDLPLFLIGGTVLGVGRGEEVYPVPDLPPLACVIALSEIAVSTPTAFAEWDRLIATSKAELKNLASSDRMMLFSCDVSAWLSHSSGVFAKGGGRAENPLLDLVRTGIENDFEKVVFAKRPELQKVKRVLERTGVLYVSLSGSGSAIYGLFDSRQKAVVAAKKLNQNGTRAVVTSTLTRRQYWKKFLVSSF